MPLLSDILPGTIAQTQHRSTGNSEVSFDDTFPERVELDGDEQVVAWDLGTTGMALTMEAFVVSTLFFQSIHCVLNRSRN